MSGVFLYVGIVAIWAFVLVPRWLRRHHAHQQPDATGMETAASSDSGDVEGGDEPYAGAPAAAVFAGVDADSKAADHDESYRRSAAGTAQAGTAQAVAAPPGRSHLPPSRTRMLQARRRLLTGLIVLAAAVGGCIEAKLIPLWSCIPPATLLVVYLLLLREVGRAESDQARQRAAADARIRAAGLAQAQARRRAEAEAAMAAQPSAQIIDISGRVGDQLYDQYADAAVRAVGD